MSKVKEIFNKIPEEKREWVSDEDGKWRYCRLFYDEKDDSIGLEITNRDGDWVDGFDATEDYVEKEVIENDN